jgi:CBS domain-containing protein
MVDGTATVRVSRVVGSPLVGPDGATVGRVEDLVARFADEGYPPVTGVLAKVGEAERFVPAHHVTTLRPGGTAIAVVPAQLSPFERRPGEVLLCRDVRGHQLIYLGEHQRGRLVRAADIHIGPPPDGGDGWCVRGVDAGQPHRWPWHRHREVAVLDWAHVEPFLHHVPTSRLRLRFRRLGQLHPGEIADLVEEASPEEAAEIIEAVGEDRDLEADVFEELDEEHQLELVAKRSDRDVAALLGKMAPDDAVDLLAEIDRDRREPILALMPHVAAQRLRNLLRYNPQTAGGLMSPGGLCAQPTDSVEGVLARFRDEDDLPDTLDTVLVVDSGGVLLGSVRTRELLRADPAAAVGTVAHPDPPRVHTSADLVEVTLRMTDYNLTTLAVVDEADRVVGIVTIDDVVEQLVPENWRRRAEAGSD